MLHVLATITGCLRRCAGLLFVAAWAPVLAAAADFAKDIEPVLAQHCYECHAEGSRKGGVAFDQYPSEATLAADHELWAKVLKNVRAGLMPPPKKGTIGAAEKERLERWIKYRAFGLDPASPDPGRVTLRRLNRVEYRNTIRDLMGVDYKTDEEFPPDDTGHGFDNIADVLTVSPLLLEKYMEAAEKVVQQGVPTVSKMIRERTYGGSSFRGEGNRAEERRVGRGF